MWSTHVHKNITLAAAGEFADTSVYKKKKDLRTHKNVMI